MATKVKYARTGNARRIHNNPIETPPVDTEGLVYDAASGMWVNAALAADFDYAQGVFCGKHGNDANDGLSPDQATLTITAAIAVAAGLTPATGNRIAVIVEDAGTYAEAVSVPSWVRLIAPAARLDGALVVADDSGAVLDSITVGTGEIGVSKAAGTGSSTVYVNDLEVAGTGIGIINTGVNSRLIVRANQITVENGVGIGDGATAEGHMHITCDDIYLTGNATAVIRFAAGDTLLSCQHIKDIGAGATTGINVAAGTVHAIVNDINTDTTYAVGGTGTLTMLVTELSGAVGAVTGTANVTVAGTAPAHDLAGAQHNADTKANLLTKLSDVSEVYTNNTGEIAGTTAKATPVGGDFALIEDSAASNAKKTSTLTQVFAAMGPGSDTDAIHDNVSAEINAIAAKGTPTTSDLLLIEDAAASNAKKKITIANLPAAAPAAHALAGAQHSADTKANLLTKLSDVSQIYTDNTGEISGTTAKATPIGADILLIEDSAASNAKKSATIAQVEAILDHTNLGAGIGTKSHATIDSELAAATAAAALNTTHRGSAGTDHSDVVLNNTHRASTANPHSTDVGNLGSGTLAELLTAISDVSKFYTNNTAEISGTTSKATPVAGDHILIEDSAASNAKKSCTVAQLGAVIGGGATVACEMHKVTAGEDTAGYFTLSSGTPDEADNVRIDVVGGPRQVSKQIVGATGSTPDFDVGVDGAADRVSINNDGSATGLSGDIVTDDVLIITYEV